MPQEWLHKSTSSSRLSGACLQTTQTQLPELRRVGTKMKAPVTLPSCPGELTS